MSDVLALHVADGAAFTPWAQHAPTAEPQAAATAAAADTGALDAVPPEPSAAIAADLDAALHRIRSQWSLDVAALSQAWNEALARLVAAALPGMLCDQSAMSARVAALLALMQATVRPARLVCAPGLCEALATVAAAHDLALVPDPDLQSGDLRLEAEDPMLSLDDRVSDRLRHILAQIDRTDR